MGQLLHLLAALPAGGARQDRSVPSQPCTPSWKKTDSCKASSLCPLCLQAHTSCLTADNRERCSSAAFPAGDPLGCRAVTGRSCQRRINQVASIYLSLYRRRRERQVVGDQQYWQVLHTPLLPVTSIPVCHPNPPGGQESSEHPCFCSHWWLNDARITTQTDFAAVELACPKMLDPCC